MNSSPPRTRNGSTPWLREKAEISQEGAISIEYTLTTMGCPIGPLIEQQIQSFLENVPGVTSVEAEMVLRPPWTPEMMSEEAKAALGYF
jgi:metal-sulfur cluster biosynthetic enzyme